MAAAPPSAVSEAQPSVLEELKPDSAGNNFKTKLLDSIFLLKNNCDYIFLLLKHYRSASVRTPKEIKRCI